MKYLVLLAASVCAFAQSTFTPLQPITGTANITPCTGCKIVANYITDALSSMNAAGSPYTVFGLDSYILCDATAGPVVITLPTATGSGRELSVKKIDSTSNACTPTRASSNTIDGATSFSLTVQYAASKLVDAAAGTWHRSHITQMGGDLSGLNTAATVAKIQGKAADVPTTKGDLYVFDGTAIKRLGVGTNTQVLTADSAQTLGVKWAAGGGGGGSASVGANDAVESSDGAGAFKDSGCAAPSGVMTCAGFATTYTGAAQTVDIKQGTAPAAQAANTFRLQANASIGTAYKWIVPSADAAGVIASDGSGALSVKTLQGTDTKVLSAGTVSGTGAGLCTDANGGATTAGCTSGGGDVYLAGNNAMTGSNSFSKDVTLSGTLTPTALGADINDYNPTNCATSLALRVDGGAADRNITGLLCASSAPADGRIITLINIGATNALVLKNESSSSTAANRFLLPADTTLPVNTAMALRYDGTSSRWRPWSRALANSGVTAGTYGDSTHVGQFTVDSAGRITAASAVASSGGTAINPVTTSFVHDDFNCGLATTGNTGCLGWNVVNSGFITTPAAVAGSPGVINFTTSGTINSVAAIVLHGALDQDLSETFDMKWKFLAVSGTAPTTNFTMRAGLFGSVSVLNPPSNGVFLEHLAADTNWFCVANNTGSSTRVDTAVAYNSATTVALRMRRIDSTHVACSVATTLALLASATEVQLTTGYPTATGMVIGAMTTNTAAELKNINLDYFEQTISGLAR